MLKKEFLFITVIGQDTRGIVAKVSGLLFRQNINIEDITQKVIEGYFVMSMLVSLTGSKPTLEKLRELLENLGVRMRLKIQVQHADLFKTMHRI